MACTVFVSCIIRRGDRYYPPLPSINGASWSFICCWRRSKERRLELELQSRCRRAFRPTGPKLPFATRAMIVAAKESFERSATMVVARESEEEIMTPSKASASWRRCSRALRYLWVASVNTVSVYIAKADKPFWRTSFVAWF